MISIYRLLAITNKGTYQNCLIIWGLVLVCRYMKGKDMAEFYFFYSTIIKQKIKQKTCSNPILHRCVPKSKEAPIKNMYKMLNSWDAAQQFLGDVYASWHFIAIICGISFCKYLKFKYYIRIVY